MRLDLIVKKKNYLFSFLRIKNCALNNEFIKKSLIEWQECLSNGDLIDISYKEEEKEKKKEDDDDDYDVDILNEEEEEEEVAIPEVRKSLRKRKIKQYNDYSSINQNDIKII